MGAIIINALRSLFTFFGLKKVVGYILGFFSSAGPFVGFFVWIGKKFGIKAVILPIQFAALGSLVVAKVAFLLAAISLVTWVYNQVHALFSALGNYVVADNLFGISYKVLESIGFIDAFYDTFTSLSFVWFSVLILIVSKFVMHSLKLASDEIFKIGLLMES